MSLQVASLNSGSNGNCYYIGNHEESVFIDAGISCRETERRMKRLGLSMKKVKAIFITHEHSDHVKGAGRLSKKYKLPVYVTPGTVLGGGVGVKPEWTVSFRPFEPIRIGDLSVTAFPKRHDAADPHSFIVADAEVQVGVFTDIGYACENVTRHFSGCHAAFLETNYDDDMLTRGSYPLPLKERIRGGYGHLSNDEAARLFMDHRPPFMSHVFLSHLSQNNNKPEIAENLFRSIAGPTSVVVASRHRETEVYTIENGFYNDSRIVHPLPRSPREMQLSLFD